VKRVRWLVGTLAVVCVAGLLPACSGGSGSGESQVVDAYLRAWRRHDYRAMAKLVDRPPADFVAFNRAVVTDLGIERSDFVRGRNSEHGGKASVSLRNRFVVRGLGTWNARGELNLIQRGGRWRIDWSPRAIDVGLQPGSHPVRKTQWPDRAPILGAGGAALTMATPMVTVGVQGSRITDAGVLTSALQGAGATPPQVSTALTTAAAHPQWFVPVFDLPQAQYEQLRPTLYPVPGTVFQAHATRHAITTDLDAHVVGSVGPITAEQLGKLGPPYQATDTVGQTGIEQAYERQLAGRPGGSIQAVGGAGNVVSTLASFNGKPGTPVQTTIDPTLQRAGEQALSAVAQPAALVAMRASTGEVVAAVSQPSQSPNIALTGQFAPGSTFKVVTTADLLEHGLTPSSPATCPATITVGGQTFRNFEGEAVPSLSLADAFAQSCNAAFIGLAANLPHESFTSTAQQFGLGVTPHLGLDAFGGKVPTPSSDAERAATAIGQAKVAVSPLAMATVAATVESGSLHAPRLVAGAPDDTTPPQPLDPTVVAGLQGMMAAVVANGTAAGAGLPPDTHGKTGTAEFGTDNPPQTHAWFIGYRGDLAFAIIVTGGGVGGAVAAPIAAKFLSATGSGG
jgi:cell division protein FtsI/penicillin-binding protein 2